MRWCIPIKNVWSFPLGQRFRKTATALSLLWRDSRPSKFPPAFSTPTADAPIGVPVGMELLGRAWAEPELIKLAFGFEQATHLRKPPVSTHALPAP